MRIKNDFVLRRVVDTYVVLPIGLASVDFNGMLSLNESGALLWKELEQGSTRKALADILIKEYEILDNDAQCDVDEFLSALKKAGCLEEEQY